MEQIIATKQSLESNGLKDFSANIIWKAYIRIHGSAPINLKEKNMDGLEQVFGKRNYRVRRDQDVGAFLRSDK
ncbi:MAG: hypothetical protein HC893_13920 [Chloroflexaceae bacterium]|nr:hypothetical protein [Chloroflexaceae bacterium]